VCLAVLATKQFWSQRMTTFLLWDPIAAAALAWVLQLPYQMNSTIIDESFV
jgi:hypothetical protein